MEKYTKQDLIDFETKIGEYFNEGKIKAPIHLYDGNEEEMIDIFSNIGYCCGYNFKKILFVNPGNNKLAAIVLSNPFFFITAGFVPDCGVDGLVPEVVLIVVVDGVDCSLIILSKTYFNWLSLSIIFLI